MNKKITMWDDGKRKKLSKYFFCDTTTCPRYTRNRNVSLQSPTSLYLNVYSSTIGKSSKLETAQMFINASIDESKWSLSMCKHMNQANTSSHESQISNNK